MNIKVVKIIGIGATIIGAGASLLASWASEKQQEATIAEKVAKEVASYFAKPETIAEGIEVIAEEIK